MESIARFISEEKPDVTLLMEITLNVDTCTRCNKKALYKVVGPTQGEYYVFLAFKIVAVLYLFHTEKYR